MQSHSSCRLAVCVLASRDIGLTLASASATDSASTTAFAPLFLILSTARVSSTASAS